jgi:hypothetical protein
MLGAAIDEQNETILLALLLQLFQPIDFHDAINGLLMSSG